MLHRPPPTVSDIADRDAIESPRSQEEARSALGPLIVLSEAGVIGLTEKVSVPGAQHPGGTYRGACVLQPWEATHWIEMTTATTLGDAVFSLNMTRGEDFLYKSSGAIVAAIVVVVIIIVAMVLILLKMYNRRMRTRRELEPKGPKSAVPPTLDPNSSSGPQPATVTFTPPEAPVETR